MSELMKEFDNADFSVEKYTKKLMQECVGGPDLQQRRKDIQNYADQTSTTLKKSVYTNYMQFIETAKEISHLEAEMYQLSHILIEQRNILASLTDEKSASAKRTQADGRRDGLAKIMGTSTTSETDGSAAGQNPHDEVENSHATRAVKEMVQGFNGNLEGKTFLNEGALIELDGNDYRPIQRVFFFLFNDVLIVCKVKHDKRLEFLAEYDPKKIAVINIKDLDGVRNAINIITPDGAKIFQSVTPAGKTEWIEKLEVAFRWDQQQQQQQQQQQKKTKKGPAPQPPNKSSSKQVPDSPSTDNRSLRSNDSTTTSEGGGSPAKSIEKHGPEWIGTACEEIQTLIAQRHFEEAESLIRRTLDHLAKDGRFVRAEEIATKAKQLEASFTHVLMQELSNCHCRNLQVTLRASRRPLQILVAMGQARQACGTLLRVCTVALRSAQREARRNNVEISELFFCDVAQVACDFLLAFEGQPACVSALVVWCNAELQHFAGQLIKHYLTKGTPLESVAKCVAAIRQPCAKLTEIGLDLSYHLEGLLRATLDQLIEEARVRLLETVGRATTTTISGGVLGGGGGSTAATTTLSDDTWQPYNLQTKSNLKRLLLELDSLGLDLRQQATGDTFIALSQSTVLFARHYLQLADYCGQLARSEALAGSLERLLRDLLRAQHDIKPAAGLSVDPNFVLKNKRFLAEELLPTAIEKFQRIAGNNTGETLLEFQRQLRKQQAPVPKQRSIYQTDVF